jgi:hypothetical protein
MQTELVQLKEQRSIALAPLDRSLPLGLSAARAGDLLPIDDHGLRVVTPDQEIRDPVFRPRIYAASKRRASRSCRE